MSFVSKAVACAFVSTGLVLAASGAFAQPSGLGCLELSKKIDAAVAANPQAPNVKEATDEQRVGRQYCLTGLYGQGMDHYSKALGLLGVSKS